MMSEGQDKREVLVEETEMVNSFRRAPFVPV